MYYNVSEIPGQILLLFVSIFCDILTFMKFYGDNYDIYENKRICISNPPWEILNRTFFNRISKYNGG